ncbi:MAG: rRNA maturation RNase YbeY [Acidimicrobiales bacterium]
MAVDVHAADEQSDHPVDLRRWSALAAAVLEAEGITSDAEVSLLFVDEDTIAVLNERFLGRSGPTDVLAFPIDDEDEPAGRTPDRGTPGPLSTEPEPEPPRLVGDVVICPAVATRNAVDHEVGADDEVALLVVHGILHLLGMDHEDDGEAERMERRERELLARFHRSA